MVRVKSDAYTKAAVKAPRKQNVLRSVSGSTPKNTGKPGSKYSGGNSYCLRPTPTWQKPITKFFSKNGSCELSAEEYDKEDIAACSSADLFEDAPGCSKAASSEDASGCSKDTSFEDVPGCSKDTSEPVEDAPGCSKDTSEPVEDAPGCSKDTSEPVEDVPGCSKDTSEPIEDVDMPDQGSDEELLSDSCLKGKSHEENCNENDSSKSDGSEM